MTYSKLSFTADKYKAVISASLFNLNNDNNSSNNEEKNSIFILQLKKCKIQSTNSSFIFIRNKADNQNYNLQLAKYSKILSSK